MDLRPGDYRIIAKAALERALDGVLHHWMSKEAIENADRAIRALEKADEIEPSLDEQVPF